jgi:hypothetical protein
LNTSAHPSLHHPSLTTVPLPPQPPDHKLGTSRTRGRYCKSIRGRSSVSRCRETRARGPLTSLVQRHFWQLQLRLTTLDTKRAHVNSYRECPAATRRVTRGALFRAPGWRGQDETRLGTCSGAQGSLFREEEEEAKNKFVHDGRSMVGCGVVRLARDIRVRGRVVLIQM